MTFGVVIPNRYPDVIAPLLKSIETYERKPKIVIVADGHDNGYGHTMIKYPDEPFVYSKAINLGIAKLKYASEQPFGDVFLVNDDCTIIQWNTFHRLIEIAQATEGCGILSPMVRGCVGNPLQRYHEKKKHWGSEAVRHVLDPDPVCFPFVYISGMLIRSIGGMDESFTGYGFDDNEYCIRARKSGFLTSITSEVVVQHGDGSAALGDGRGKSWSVSFARRERERN